MQLKGEEMVATDVPSLLKTSVGRGWISNEKGVKYLTGVMLCTTNRYAPWMFPKSDLSGHKQKEDFREATNNLRENTRWQGNVQQASKKVIDYLEVKRLAEIF